MPRARLARRLELAALAERVRQLQAAWRPARGRCPTGLTKLDAVLGGGFALGAIHELLTSADGAAARSLALWVAARAVEDGSRPYATTAGEAPVARGYSHTLRGSARQHPGRWVSYIDTGDDFYPPGAAQLGVPLERLVVIRTRRTAEALWVCEQALRCKAVAAVVLPIRTVNVYVSRRLQLAAEVGGGLGFLLRSENRAGHTFAATRLRLDPLPMAETAADDIHIAYRVRVRFLKLRDGRLPEPFELALPGAAGWGITPRWAFPARPAYPSAWAS